MSPVGLGGDSPQVTRRGPYRLDSGSLPALQLSMALPLVTRARRSIKRGPGQYDRSKSATERRAEQRALLIAASAEVFAAKGFNKASVDAVIRGARMSRRTFYEHFEDLTGAFLAVYDFAVMTLFEHVETQVRAESDPIKSLRAGIHAYLRMYGRHAELARVVHREILAAGPKHSARHRETLGRFVRLFSEGIDEAHDLGMASRKADETTIYAIVAGIEAVGMRYVEDGQADRIEEAVEPLTEIVMRTFR